MTHGMKASSCTQKRVKWPLTDEIGTPDPN